MLQANFYKIISGLGLIGIFSIVGLLIPIASKKSNNYDQEIKNAIAELKEVRKEALKEVKTIKKDLLTEIKQLKAESINEISFTKDEAIKLLKNKSDIGGETVWLVMRYGNLGANSLAVLPMKDMAECQFQGAIWESSKNVSKSGSMGFECLEGK